LNSSLEEVDPEIADIIELEKARQWKVYIGFSVSSYSMLFASIVFLVNVKYAIIHKFVEYEKLHKTL
jgi:hypothetical protein